MSLPDSRTILSNRWNTREKKKKKKGKKKARSRDSGAHRKGGLGSQSGPAYSILPFPSSKSKNFLFFRIIALDQRTTARSAASLLSPLFPLFIEPRVAKQWFPSRTGAVQPAQCGKLRWLRTTWTPPFIEPRWMVVGGEEGILESVPAVRNCERLATYESFVKGWASIPRFFFFLFFFFLLVDRIYF